MSAFETQLKTVTELSTDERIPKLVELATTIAGSDDAGAKAQLVSALVQVIESGDGDSSDRIVLGELLGNLGDPRLRTPDQPDYWVEVQAGGVALKIGRFPVTNAEYRAFVDGGGYEERSNWSDAGWAWLQSTDDPWAVHAARESNAHLVVDNQPVVGISFYEASAYGRSVGARLPRVDERVSVVRGEAKRPYPWGSPFGEGNANTREEVVSRPSAVGLFRNDSTPEGVFDLAGNAAEWTSDPVGDDVLIHPGAWDQPSLAAWAKALSSASRSDRWSGLGFRLVR